MDELSAPHHAVRIKKWHGASLSSAWIWAILIGWLGGSQLLLWRFLDIFPAWIYVAGAALLAGLCFHAARTVRHWGDSRLSVGTLLTCFLIALLLLILSGEGRFFYANLDWQVRFAVLRDMAINPWPFVYTTRPEPDLLRAPIGMFLMPALAFKAFGQRAGDIALLLQNAVLFSLLLALASLLFSNRRARLIGLTVFLCFSGMDALGDLLRQGRLTDHLDNWAGIQYSSTITLLFWVPQHAFSAWVGAVGYMLWRDGRLPLAPWLIVLPLTALWSPLGLMGTMPFVALAGIRTLMARVIPWRDAAVSAAALLLCLPTLAYLAAAGDDVGARLLPLPFLLWLLFQSLETLPFLIPLLLGSRGARFGRDSLWLATFWLLLIPFVQIGWSIDFMMRGSITALALVTVMVSDELTGRGRMWRWFMAVLAIGSLTGLSEIRRALVFPAAPQVQCSFSKAWDQSFGSFPKGSYLAPIDKVPALVRPVNPTRAPSQEPARCWKGEWPAPVES